MLRNVQGNFESWKQAYILTTNYDTFNEDVFQLKVRHNLFFDLKTDKKQIQE